MQTGNSNSGKLLAGNNRTIWMFFIKLFLVIVVWQCCYQFILEPIRVPDKFLTDLITGCVTWWINLISGSDGSYYSWAALPEASSIMKDGKAVFYVADTCNALDLMVIYLGLIILLPYSAKRKLLFGIGGLIVIVLFNIVRCLALYYIYVNNRASFHFNHHYVFTLLMYLLIFGLWLLFTKKSKVYEVG